MNRHACTRTHAQEEAVTLCRQKLGVICIFSLGDPLSASTPNAEESVSAETKAFLTVTYVISNLRRLYQEKSPGGREADTGDEGPKPALALQPSDRATDRWETSAIAWHFMQLGVSLAAVLQPIAYHTACAGMLDGKERRRLLALIQESADNTFAEAEAAGNPIRASHSFDPEVLAAQYNFLRQHAEEFASEISSLPSTTPPSSPPRGLSPQRLGSRLGPNLKQLLMKQTSTPSERQEVLRAAAMAATSPRGKLTRRQSLGGRAASIGALLSGRRTTR